MVERHYSEEEVARILEKATEVRESGLRRTRASDGLTLGELQEIGREVGISPELIAEAARTVGDSGSYTTTRFAGLPLGVGRTVQLHRKLTKDEWEHLVVDLRRTFDARGKLRVEGPFREWTNGNLQALLEPTPDGDRLRIRTLKGSARAMMTTGLIMTAVGTVLLLASVLTGGLADGDRSGDLVTIALVGVGLFGLSAVRLPGWARLRRRQMAGVIDRLFQELRSPLPGEPDSPIPDTKDHE